jgi:hypothetical protein
VRFSKAVFAALIAAEALLISLSSLLGVSVLAFGKAKSELLLLLRQHC